MDIIQFREEEIEKAKKSMEDSIYRENERYEELKTIEEKIKSLQIPDKTDVLEKIAKHKGEECEISYVAWENLQKEEVVLKFDIGGNIYVPINSVHVPFLGNDFIVSIKNKETGEIIYENEYLDENLIIQKAYILGKEVAIKHLNSDLKHCEYNKKWAIDNYNRTVEALNKFEELYEEGKKYIYPQRYEKWAECVANRLADLYHGTELEEAIKIIKELDEGKKLEEVKDLISNGHSGNFCGMLCKIVTVFSKHGVEFAKEYNDFYKYDLKKAKEKPNEEYYKNELKQWEDWFNKLEEENARYEQELKEEQTF